MAAGVERAVSRRQAGGRAMPGQASRGIPPSGTRAPPARRSFASVPPPRGSRGRSGGTGPASAAPAWHARRTGAGGSTEDRFPPSDRSPRAHRWRWSAPRRSEYPTGAVARLVAGLHSGPFPVSQIRGPGVVRGAPVRPPRTGPDQAPRDLENGGVSKKTARVRARFADTLPYRRNRGFRPPTPRAMSNASGQAADGAGGVVGSGVGWWSRGESNP